MQSELLKHPPPPPVTPVALPPSAPGVLSSSPEMAVPTLNKAITLGNPPETAVPAQEMSSPEEASIPTGGDQPNGVAATGMEVKPVTQQGVPADPPQALVGSPTSEESMPSAEPPVKEVENPELVVAAEELAGKELKKIAVEEKVSGEEPVTVAGKVPDDPKPSSPIDICSNSEDSGMAEGPRNLCLDAVQEVLPGEAKSVLEALNENLEKKEPLILLSQAIQSKGTSKCEGPPISTSHLSGSFQRGLPLFPTRFAFIEYTFLVGLGIYIFHMG